MPFYKSCLQTRVETVASQAAQVAAEAAINVKTGGLRARNVNGKVKSS